MGKIGYPTQAEVEALLTSAGVALGTLDTATAPTTARLEFERRIHRVLLAPAADATRYYDVPPAGAQLLNLGADLATVTSVEFQPAGASAEALTQDTDYWLVPLNAAADGQPWTHLELRRRYEGPTHADLKRSIRVTGRWGYGTSIPEDAWDAIRKLAALSLLPAAGASLSGGRLRTEEAGVLRDYGADPLGGVRKAWEAEVKRAVGRYRRLGV